jgi:predicted O-linked N-acetylglucosamine transferase (SPINDLY family)
MNAVLPRAQAALNRLGTPAFPGMSRRMPISKLLAYANRLHKAGKLPEAESAIRTVLAQQPDHPMALLSLGIIARQSGDPAAAIGLMKRAIEIAPTYHQAFNNLGNIYAAQGRLDEAVEHYKTAIELHPDYGDAHFNLGKTLHLQNDCEQALESLLACRHLTPRRADLHLEIAQCYLKLGNRYQAQIAYRVALDIDPEFVNARNGIGRLLASIGRYDDAVDEFRHALITAPNNPLVRNGLSEALRRTGHFEEALQLLNQTEALTLETLLNLGTTHQVMGEIESAADYYEQVLSLLPQADFAEKSILFVALNRPQLDTDTLFDLHRRLRARHDRPEAKSKDFTDRSHDLERKLKIGFVSSDLRGHVVALNIFTMMTNFDRDLYDIYLYAQERSTDHMTRMFKSLATKYTPINRYNDDEAAKLIEEDEIDILVLLAGRFDENRPLIAARRAAPVQVSFHDCATSGLEDMDYYLTDSILHPQDTVEKFTEQLYRLPVYYQYPVQNALPGVSPVPALTNGFITFGSFNKPEKINEEVVALWSEVLHAVPGSKLFLKYFNHYSEPSMQNRWLAKFAAHGIDEDRLILKAKIDIRARHLELYYDVDIALDPFPFNGATTTFEALSMGVPVVSLLGRHFVDRVAASMVSHAGYPDFVAEDRADYVALAQILAGDLDRLAELRTSIRDHLHASPLCDGPGYARTVESAFRDMWQTWVKTGGYRGR